MEGIGQMESSFVEGQVVYRGPEIENVAMSAAIGVKALKDILAQMS